MKYMWLALTFIFIILAIGFSTRLGTVYNKPAPLPNLNYHITHRTCAGKIRGIYPRCNNIRNEQGFVCFDIIDSTSDVIGYMIMGGIVKVEIKKEIRRK